MKNKFCLILVVVSLLTCIISCSKIKKTGAEIEREEWIAGFPDSIAFYEKKRTDAEKQLENVNARIASLIENFEMVKNPREVSGYYILKGWNGKLPFTNTGIYARINENEKLELIATLGGSTFNRLGIGEDQSVLFSETVSHDQAFNYRHERFNTVFFSGGKADTIAEYISNHMTEQLKLDFMEGDKRKSFLVPSDEKAMIAKTWDLYATQLEARKLQKDLWISSRKIETFRRLMEMQNQKDNASDNKSKSE